MHEVKRLKWAQLKHTRELLNDIIERRSYGDDTHDDVTGALDLSAHMMRLCIDDDEQALHELLDAGLADYACGAIAEAFYALKPKALAYLED